MEIKLRFMQGIVGATILFAGACRHEIVQQKEIPYEKASLDFIDKRKGYAFGDQNAPITMIEYSSYECMDCKRLHENIGDVLNDYVEKGQIRYIFKPINHPKFKYDARINERFRPASLNDIQMIYKKFNDFFNQDWPTIKKVLELPQEIQPEAKELNREIAKELRAGNIRITPTIFINEMKFSETIFSKEEFTDLIARFLKESKHAN